MSVFDEKAGTWDDDPTKLERARVVAEAIRAAVPLTRTTRVLEYGAGTAQLSQELAGDVGPITAADPSEGMREIVAAKVADGRLPEGTRVWDLDLSGGDVPQEHFDLVATVLTLHHIHELEPVLNAFATLLEDGGHLCVVDLVAEDGSFHDEGFDGHHGFDTDDLTRQIAEAGFDDVDVRHVHDLEKNGALYPLFLATATKAQGSRG
jgi:SAM-dependent methyltransferase